MVSQLEGLEKKLKATCKKPTHFSFKVFSHITIICLLMMGCKGTEETPDPTPTPMPNPVPNPTPEPTPVEPTFEPHAGLAINTRWVYILSTKDLTLLQAVVDSETAKWKTYKAPEASAQNFFVTTPNGKFGYAVSSPSYAVHPWIASANGELKKAVERQSLNASPGFMVFSPDSNKAYIASLNNSGIYSYIINSNTGGLTQTAMDTLPQRPVSLAITQTGKYLVAAHDQSLSVFDVVSKGFSQPVIVSLPEKVEKIIAHDQVILAISKQSLFQIRNWDQPSPNIVQTSLTFEARDITFSAGQNFVYLLGPQQIQGWTFKDGQLANQPKTWSWVGGDLISLNADPSERYVHVIDDKNSNALSLRIGTDGSLRYERAFRLQRGVKNLAFSAASQPVKLRSTFAYGMEDKVRDFGNRYTRSLYPQLVQNNGVLVPNPAQSGGKVSITDYMITDIALPPERNVATLLADHGYCSQTGDENARTCGLIRFYDYRADGSLVALGAADAPSGLRILNDRPMKLILHPTLPRAYVLQRDEERESFAYLVTYGLSADRLSWVAQDRQYINFGADLMALDDSGRYLFISSTLGNRLLPMVVQNDGIPQSVLEYNEALPSGSSPMDMMIEPGGQYLHIINRGRYIPYAGVTEYAGVSTLQINPNGTLTFVSNLDYPIRLTGAVLGPFGNYMVLGTDNTEKGMFITKYDLKSYLISNDNKFTQKSVNAEGYVGSPLSGDASGKFIYNRTIAGSYPNFTYINRVHTVDNQGTLTLSQSSAPTSISSAQTWVFNRIAE